MNNKSSNELIQLITKGYFEQVQVKLTNNQFDFLNNPDDEGRTPIILCGLIDDINWSISLIRQLIINGANLKRRDYNKMNIFHYSCLLEKIDLLVVLLESLDFDINCKDIYGNTPLLYAISTNNNELIDVLINYYKKYNIQIDSSNNSGINAFMQACICENVELIEKLRQFDVDETICDVSGKSALEYREEFYSKSQFMKQLKENRRQSRNVRFDDLKLIRELQEKNKELLNQNAEKESNSNDQNIQLVKDFQSRYKPIKINQKDIIRPRFMLRCNSNTTENDRLMKWRPKTASVLNSIEKRKLNDWYSLMRPICASLEQQFSPSFRLFVSKREADPSPESIRQTSRRSSVLGGGKNGRRQSVHQRSRRESVCDTISESGPDRVLAGIGGPYNPLARWGSVTTNNSSGGGSRPTTAGSIGNAQWIGAPTPTSKPHKKKLDNIVSAKMIINDRTKSRLGVHAT